MEEDFPSSSVGKESTCNEGDPGLIPGSRRPGGEGISYPLQYSWVSLMAQLVKILPAMWETWVQSLGWEEPLEKGTANHSSILAWRIWQEYTEELYKKDFHDPDNHDGMITDLEPDILECEVKWALGASVRTKLVEVIEFQLSYFKS